jgi:hypothetical protein
MGKKAIRAELHNYIYSFILDFPNKIYRKIILHRFPYCIVYEVIGETVVVYAIHHFSKHPKNKLQK